jgi:hypothetical protein
MTERAPADFSVESARPQCPVPECLWAGRLPRLSHPHPGSSDNVCARLRSAQLVRAVRDRGGHLQCVEDGRKRWMINRRGNHASPRPRIPHHSDASKMANHFMRRGPGQDPTRRRRTGAPETVVREFRGTAARANLDLHIGQGEPLCHAVPGCLSRQDVPQD